MDPQRKHLQELVEAAKQAEREEDLDRAVGLYTEALSLDGPALDVEQRFQILRARINRGLIFHRQDRDDRARADWEAAAYTAAPRDEWVDRARIRALRNLAFVEGLPPYRSPHLRHALGTFWDSPHFTVHRVLFEAALETEWVYPPDDCVPSMVRFLAGQAGTPEELLLAWATLNEAERQRVRSWRGSVPETQMVQRLARLGPPYRDEAGYTPVRWHAPLCRIREQPLGRGGIKALFGGGELPGWLTSDHRVEFLPDRQSRLESVRLAAWSETHQALAVVTDVHRGRIEVLDRSGTRRIQNRRAVTGLAWADELGWVDDGGYFCAKHPVDSNGLAGIASWKGGFRVWNAHGQWDLNRDGTAVEARGQGGDWAVSDHERFALVRGRTVVVEEHSGRLRTLELPVPPERGALGPHGWSAWVAGGVVHTFEGDRPVRRYEGLTPTCLFWLEGTLLVGSQDWSVRVLHPRKPGADRTIRHHTDWVTDFHYDAARGRLWISGLDGQVSVWNPESWELVDILAQKAGLRLLWRRGWYRLGLAWALTPDRATPIGWGDPWVGAAVTQEGLNLLSLGGRLWGPNGVREWPGARTLLSAGDVLYISTAGRLERSDGIAWDLPDAEDWATAAIELGRTLVIGTHGGAVWELWAEGFRALESLHRKTVVRFLELPEALRYPGVGAERFFASFAEDGQVVIWDRENLRPIEVLKTGGAPLRGLLACGRVLVGWNGSPELLFWGLPGSSGFWTVKAHAKGVAACVSDPSHRVLVSGGKDGEVKAWELPHGRLLARVLRLEEPIADMAWGPPGVLGVLGYGGEVTEIDLSNYFGS